MPDRPPEMYTGAREPDPAFDPAELLYCRVAPERVRDDGTVDPLHVSCPDLSSNRSKYSLPWHVLYPRDKFGGYAVFGFQYNDVPKTIQGDNLGAKVHQVETVHDPEPDNYGHCETRVSRDGVRLASNKIGPEVKTKFRLHISKVMKLMRQPGEPFPPPQPTVRC